MQDLKNRNLIIEVEPYYVKDLKSVAIYDPLTDRKKSMIEIDFEFVSCSSN